MILLENMKDSNARMVVKLEKSVFSKTMRFTPEQLGPDSAFDWHHLRRQQKTRLQALVNSAEVALNDSFENFLQPFSLNPSNMWFCHNCSKFVCE
jgi:hypothetical protein